MQFKSSLEVSMKSVEGKEFAIPITVLVDESPQYLSLPETHFGIGFLSKKGS